MSETKSKRLDWHLEAIAELAESLAWYARHNPVAAKRMRKVIEQAARSLIATPIAVSGRIGVVAGTRELPVVSVCHSHWFLYATTAQAIAPFFTACTNDGITR